MMHIYLSALVATWTKGTPHRIQQIKEAVFVWHLCWIWYFMDNGLSCSSTIYWKIMYSGDAFVCISFTFGALCFYWESKLDSNCTRTELFTWIQVWEHACDVGEFRGRAFRDRVTPQWEMRFSGSENRLLKVIDFCGFRSLEQQFKFIRSMLERSPNLQKIILRGDEECYYCSTLDASLRPSKFPRKDDQEMVVKRIRSGIFSPMPEIIFDENCSLKIWDMFWLLLYDCTFGLTLTVCQKNNLYTVLA